MLHQPRMYFLQRGEGSFGKNQSNCSDFKARLIGFGLKKEHKQEHQARTGIIVKCRPHGICFFFLLLSVSCYPTAPFQLWLACSFFSNIVDLTLVPVSAPLCGKRNSNHSRICPSLSHCDGPHEVGGGGHTDCESLQPYLCVCVCAIVTCTVQRASQRTLMLLVVCCGCGRDKRLTVGVLPLNLCTLESLSELKCNKSGFMSTET